MIPLYFTYSSTFKWAVVVL